MKRAWQRIKAITCEDQRGTVWILTLILLLGLLAAGGLAIDTMHAVAVRNELQKSMDAAALAGAGNLGFSASLFPTARLASQTYAGLNPYSGGTITLGLNTGNATNGDIVLGLYKAADGSFTPTLDPVQNLVYHAHARDVEMVLVDGAIVVDDGRLRTVDAAALVDRAQDAALAAWSRFTAKYGGW